MQSLTFPKVANDKSTILPAVIFIGWPDMMIINIRLRAILGDSSYQLIV